MRWLMMLITGYQRLLRPWLAPRCRFHPSCSDYALEALQRFGLFHGGWLASKRLIKCHPLNPGGVDLVPPHCRTHPSSH